MTRLLLLLVALVLSASTVVAEPYRPMRRLPRVSPYRSPYNRWHPVPRRPIAPWIGRLPARRFVRPYYGPAPRFRFDGASRFRARHWSTRRSLTARTYRRGGYR